MTFEQLCGRCQQPGVVGIRQLDHKRVAVCKKCMGEIDAFNKPARRMRARVAEHTYQQRKAVKACPTT